MEVRNAGTTVAKRPGFFARVIGTLRNKFRRLFGKAESPNIYPFF
jgi:hypothetical protein